MTLDVDLSMACYRYCLKGRMGTELSTVSLRQTAQGILRGRRLHHAKQAMGSPTRSPLRTHTPELWTIFPSAIALDQRLSREYKLSMLLLLFFCLINLVCEEEGSS